MISIFSLFNSSKNICFASITQHVLIYSVRLVKSANLLYFEESPQRAGLEKQEKRHRQQSIQPIKQLSALQIWTRLIFFLRNSFPAIFQPVQIMKV